MSSIELLQVVMRLLRPEWVIQPHDGPRECVHFVDPTDSEMGVECYVGTAFMSVRGLWPKRSVDGTYPSRYEKPINISLSKSPEAIAKEIERRLLRAYMWRYAEERALADRAAANHVKQLETIELMVKLVNGMHFGNRVSTQDLNIEVQPDCTIRVLVCTMDVEYATAVVQTFLAHQREMQAN